jgi:hypothetical protein
MSQSARPEHEGFGERSAPDVDLASWRIGLREKSPRVDEEQALTLGYELKSPGLRVVRTRRVEAERERCNQRREV